MEQESVQYRESYNMMNSTQLLGEEKQNCKMIEKLWGLDSFVNGEINDIALTKDSIYLIAASSGEEAVKIVDTYSN